MYTKNPSKEGSFYTSSAAAGSTATYGASLQPSLLQMETGKEEDLLNEVLL